MEGAFAFPEYTYTITDQQRSDPMLICDTQSLHIALLSLNSFLKKYPELVFSPNPQIFLLSN